MVECRESAQQRQRLAPHSIPGSHVEVMHNWCKGREICSGNWYTWIPALRHEQRLTNATMRDHSRINFKAWAQVILELHTEKWKLKHIKLKQTLYGTPTRSITILEVLIQHTDRVGLEVKAPRALFTCMKEKFCPAVQATLCTGVCWINDNWITQIMRRNWQLARAEESKWTW